MKKIKYLLFVVILSVAAVLNAGGQQVFEKSFDIEPSINLNEYAAFIKGYENMIKIYSCLSEIEKYLQKILKEVEEELKYFERENLIKSPNRVVEVWGYIRIYSGRISHYLENVKEILGSRNMVLEETGYSFRDFSVMDRRGNEGDDRILACGFPIYELQEPRYYTGARKIFRRKYAMFSGMEFSGSNYGKLFLKKAMESGEYCAKLIGDMGEDRNMFEYSMEKNIETKAVTYKRKEEIVVMENVFADLYKYSKLQEEIYRIYGE